MNASGPSCASSALSLLGLRDVYWWAFASSGRQECDGRLFDLAGDGVEEVMWGERAIELDTGSELFCAHRHSCRGHSGVV